MIVEAVKRTLERTPPELAADIVDRGIMLAGGGALVRGISDLISHETGIFVHVAEDPLLCVVNGCGQVLEDWKRLQRVVDTPEFVRSSAASDRMAPSLWPGQGRWRGARRPPPWVLFLAALLMVRLSKGAGFADAYALLSRPSGQGLPSVSGSPPHPIWNSGHAWPCSSRTTNACGGC